MSAKRQRQEAKRNRKMKIMVNAKFPGRCPECGNPWGVGDCLTLREGIEEGEPKWRHDLCPEEPEANLNAPHPVCSVCWLTHPEGACDRDD